MLITKRPDILSSEITPESVYLNRRRFIQSVSALLIAQTIEDRAYRLRCVEGWSMVIPWQGFQLSAVVKRLEPAPQAKYIEFQTLYDPQQLPEQKNAVLQWPYVEALRMDEAMNPLAILAVGLYGKQPLPNQNGAPIR